jgi:dipeptidyl aminopeptidase/acylaminoacyl peptidase
VHEYGGGDFTVRKGCFIFCNDKDQRLYRLHHNQPIAITPESPFTRSIRYADMHIHPDGDCLVAVRECHPENGNPHEVINDIILLDLTTKGTIKTLVSGADFYAYPRFSPNGNELAWICWDHPNMPWDDTSLYCASFSAQSVENQTEVMSEKNESIYQPSWCPDGQLHFVSDRSNWWNIYSLRDGILNALTPMSAEFGFPQWQFGIRSYQFIDDDHLATIYAQDGYEHLALVELSSGHVKSLDLDFCYFQGGLQFDSGWLYFIAASTTSGSAVYGYELCSDKLLLISGDPELYKHSISEAEAICFATTDDDHAYAFFYPPLNDQYQAQDGELPPCIVMSHGGPTGSTNAAMSPAIQYWTQRGFAVADVNYRGSTGFGRAFRDRLKGQWGIRDVDDCIAVVDYLVAEQKIDPSRVAIRGGSAGGLTVYCALQKSNRFAAGVSRYGVADLCSLAEDTHKFELKYMDQLIAPWPDGRPVFEQRSPINHTDKFSTPMLLLQGDEDAVVPPSQSTEMAQALEAKSIPHKLVMLKGEQHGFRRSENIVKALELELNFYRQVFGIQADEELAELELEYSEKLSSNG